MNSDTSPILFLDLDDCGAGCIWPSPDRPRCPIDRRVFAQLLDELGRHDVAVHFLTNRPPAQLALTGHILGGPALYHFAESGMSAWLPDENRAIVNPAFDHFASVVRPEIMSRLRREIGLSWRGPVVEEFGDRLVTVTVFPLDCTGDAVASLTAHVRNLLADLPVEVRQGKGADIMPAGATKLAGCLWAEDLHPRLHGRPIDWRKVLYVEDSVTGLEAARYIAAHGGTLAAVANAEPDFRRAVEEAGGILCRRAEVDGVVQALRLWLEQPWAPE